MTNDSEQKIEGTEETVRPAEAGGVGTGTSQDDGDPEFKITVRKLEMPVRPRGVLAE